MRGLTEVAVDAVGVEAELLQLLLQLGDVITDELIARLEGQHAGAEFVGGQAQLPQGQLVDVAAGDDAPGLLEGLENLSQVLVEELVILRVLLGVPVREIVLEIGQKAEPGQGGASLCHSGAAVADMKCLHYDTPSLGQMPQILSQPSGVGRCCSFVVCSGYQLQM